MDKQEQEHQWLEWAKELQFIAQAGLTYTKDPFDKERFERVREIAAEIISLQGRLPLAQVKDLFCNETGFQTPKLDTRAAIFKDDKILLVEENDGTWSLPGGWVDVMETVKSNTVKEVKEEAGLDVEAVRVTWKRCGSSLCTTATCTTSLHTLTMCARCSCFAR